MKTGTTEYKGETRYTITLGTGNDRKRMAFKSKVARDQKVKELNRTGVLASLGDTEKLSVIEAIRLSRSFGFSLFEAAR